MKKEPKKAEHVGTLTLRGLSEMSKERRAETITWLRAQIKSIQKDHKTPGFSKVYTARLLF